MKLFCNCNSKWEYQGNNDILCWLFEKGYIGINELLEPVYNERIVEYCDTCGTSKWYDVYYENIMFDLKNMNQM